MCVRARAHTHTQGPRSDADSHAAHAEDVWHAQSVREAAEVAAADELHQAEAAAGKGPAYLKEIPNEGQQDPCPEFLEFEGGMLQCALHVSLCLEMSFYPRVLFCSLNSECYALLYRALHNAMARVLCPHRDRGAYNLPRAAVVLSR